jgi:parallel beta-helix repeat protein
VRLRGSGRATRLVVTAETGLRLEGLKGAAVAELSLMGNGTARQGIVIDNSGTCQVQDVYAQGFTEYGIVLQNNSFLCEISSCKLADNRKANLYLANLFQGGRGGDFVQNEVKNCIVYRGGHGIECNRAIVVDIVGCSVFQPSGYGYYVHSGSNSVLISGSRTYQTESHPVVVNDSHEINISGNIFCWQRGHGIVLHNVSWGSVSSNNIIDSGVRTRDGSHMNGIVIEGSKGLQVTANAIFNWGDQAPMLMGITEDGASHHNLIAHNNINYFTGQAVQSAGKGTLVKDNVSEGPDSFQSMNKKPYPDFDTKRIDAFLLDTTTVK